MSGIRERDIKGIIDIFMGIGRYIPMENCAGEM
jgi:hypothetical protein